MKRSIFSCTFVIWVFLLNLTTVGAASIGLSNFQKQRNYTSGTFADNSPSDWFYKNVVSVYEYGLMSGSGHGRFQPRGNVTVAETIAMAVRINSIYTGNGLPNLQAGRNEAWYAPYVRSAQRWGLIEHAYANYNAVATRAQFAEIMASSIYDSDLKQINNIEDGGIPDVGANSAYADAVYRLYRAGVLAGSDGSGKFHPGSTISRAEAAAVVTRIINPSLRISVKLDKFSDQTITLPDGAYPITLYRGGTEKIDGKTYEKIGLMSYEELSGETLRALRVGDQLVLHDGKTRTIEGIKRCENGDILLYDGGFGDIDCRYIPEKGVWRCYGASDYPLVYMLEHYTLPTDGVIFIHTFAGYDGGRNIYGVPCDFVNDDKYSEGKRLIALSDYFEHYPYSESVWGEMIIRDGEVQEIDITMP